MLKIIDNVLTAEECQELIGMVEKQFQQATTLGQNIDGYRTAQNAWIYQSTPLTKKIKDLIFLETGLPIENQENIHIVKYDVGGQYKNHHDFFHPGEGYYDNEVTNRGGQRLFSCLIYLNDDFTGGETNFPKKNTMVDPKIGKMVVWRNLNPDGSLDHDSIHAGLPVKSGQKFICVVWVRENKFR